MRLTHKTGPVARSDATAETYRGGATAALDNDGGLGRRRRHGFLLHENEVWGKLPLSTYSGGEKTGKTNDRTATDVSALPSAPGAHGA